MKISSVKYLVGEGAKNAWVNRLMTIASVGVLVACMVIIGLAILISENVNKAVGKLEQQNVVMAYMKDYNWALYGDDKDNSSEDVYKRQANIILQRGSSAFSAGFIFRAKRKGQTSFLGQY